MREMLKKARVAKLIGALKSGASTLTELSEASEMHRSTVADWLTAFRASEPKLVQLVKWSRSTTRGGSLYATYTWGSGPDAKRPPKRTKSERDAMYRSRQAEYRANSARRALQSVWRPSVVSEETPQNA